MGYRLHPVTRKAQHGDGSFNHLTREVEEFFVEYLSLANPDLGLVYRALSVYDDKLEIEVEAMENLIHYMRSLPADEVRGVLGEYSNAEIAEILEQFLAVADTSWDWMTLEWF